MQMRGWIPAYAGMTVGAGMTAHFAVILAHAGIHLRFPVILANAGIHLIARTAGCKYGDGFLPTQE
jgi:hypothetical protein